MRFGKIDYINLLPFHIFIKHYPTLGHFKKFIELKKSYPAKLNREFLFRRIDAGFISSIAGRGKRCSCVGIVAKKRVLSVLAIPAKEGSDYQSATSNALLKVLSLKGQVLIGDRALHYYLTHQGECVDMGEVWNRRHHLPFVFAKFCYNRYGEFYERIARKFAQQKIFIPHYILKEYEKRTQIARKDILFYLRHISYKIDTKAKKGLKRFYRTLDEKRIRAPRRF
ncbi:MAG: MqnA/MqnD/SBP family protein [Wolinella sp.]